MTARRSQLRFPPFDDARLHPLQPLARSKALNTDRQEGQLKAQDCCRRPSLDDGTFRFQPSGDERASSHLSGDSYSVARGGQYVTLAIRPMDL
jgi:hypothetical protein